MHELTNTCVVCFCSFLFTFSEFNAFFCPLACVGAVVRACVLVGTQLHDLMLGDLDVLGVCTSIRHCHHRLRQSTGIEVNFRYAVVIHGLTVFP